MPPQLPQDGDALVNQPRTPPRLRRGRHQLCAGHGRTVLQKHSCQPHTVARAPSREPGAPLGTADTGTPSSAECTEVCTDVGSPSSFLLPVRPHHQNGGHTGLHSRVLRAENAPPFQRGSDSLPAWWCGDKHRTECEMRTLTRTDGANRRRKGKRRCRPTPRSQVVRASASSERSGRQQVPRRQDEDTRPTAVCPTEGWSTKSLTCSPQTVQVPKHKESLKDGPRAQGTQETGRPRGSWANCGAVRDSTSQPNTEPAAVCHSQVPSVTDPPW